MIRESTVSDLPSDEATAIDRLAEILTWPIDQRPTAAELARTLGLSQVFVKDMIDEVRRAQLYPWQPDVRPEPPAPTGPQGEQALNDYLLTLLIPEVARLDARQLKRRFGLTETYVRYQITLAKQGLLRND